MKHEAVIILDLGGGQSQALARRVRSTNVYCEVLPYTTSPNLIRDKNPKGIIISGTTLDESIATRPKLDEEIYRLGLPILAIDYGTQVLLEHFKGQVKSVDQDMTASLDIGFVSNSPLYHGLSTKDIRLDGQLRAISQLASGFRSIAKVSSNNDILAIENEEEQLYGFMLDHQAFFTQWGMTILKNFLYHICNCSGDWKMQDYAETTIKSLREQIGDRKVLCALSGGVDSSVAALLIHKAVGKQLVCIFVDHGLMRKGEPDQVEEVFGNKFDLNLIRVNAQDRFLNKLKGIEDPERKRKIIGEEFIRVFEEEAKKIGSVDFLVQGTIYPDIIESGVGGSMIKSHHNVGGLPDHVDFKEIIEPLRDLFKDEVRQVGEILGIPRDLVWRQPFPGPGLAIRVIGDITQERLDILREADAIYREEIARAGLDKEIWQYFTVLTNMRSVGVTKSKRTYDYTIALRGVTSIDGMTADWARIPFDVLDRISKRITSEVGQVNRVVYDITSKPPATIEWE
jgi:GMP synthase (glutamine-hydrolysing)